MRAYVQSERMHRMDLQEMEHHFEAVEKIRARLKDILKPDRYEHSLSVSFSSIALAMRYGCDIEKAEIAGLVHDCAKHLGKKELLHACETEGILLTEELYNSPQVLHSLYGPIYARKLFGIMDRDILRAVESHTLGRADMSLLEEIVFTADYIEARRYSAPRLRELRMLAFTDLELCIYEILKDTMTYLGENGKAPCSQSLECYSFYKDKAESRGYKE